MYPAGGILIRKSNFELFLNDLDKEIAVLAQLIQHYNNLTHCPLTDDDTIYSVVLHGHNDGIVLDEAFLDDIANALTEDVSPHEHDDDMVLDDAFLDDIADALINDTESAPAHIAITMCSWP